MLTLSMIVKNEEKYLRECLLSVEGVADEIVLVDTGSTDGTLKIAEEFNCRIYNFEWVNDFAAARNFALSKSKGSWILYLDADERLNSASKEEVLKLTAKEKKLGVQCIVNSIDEQKGQPQIMKYIRLFNNSGGIGFEGCVHEQIENSLHKNGYEIIDSGIEIIHVGYNVPKEELNIKAKRNLELLKGEYQKNASAYYAYQLANTYSILDEREEASRYYKAALEDSSLHKEYRAYASMYLADKLLLKGNADEAENYIRLGKKENQHDVLLNLVASQVYLRKNNLPEALNCCHRAYEQNKKIRLGKAYSKVFNVSVRPEKIIFHMLYIALIGGDRKIFSAFINELKTLGKNGKRESITAQYELIEVLLNNRNINSIEVGKFCTAVNEDNLPLVLALIKSYQYKETAGLLLEGLKERFGNNSKYLNTYGLILVDLGKPEAAEKIFKKSLTLEEKEPATIFYLISLYVQRQKFEQITEIINIADKEFGNVPEVSVKIEQLKKKLSELIK